MSTFKMVCSQWNATGSVVVLVLLATINCIISTPTVSVVNKCPSDATSWDKRAAVLGCKESSKVYHCLLNDNEDLVELCMERRQIQSDIVGCPTVSTGSGTPEIMTSYDVCHNLVPGCPEVDHEPYYTDQLYKYPECISPEINRNPRRRLLAEEIFEFENSTSKGNSTDTQTPNMVWIAGPIAGGACVIIIIVVVVVVLIKRKGKPKKDYAAASTEDK